MAATSAMTPIGNVPVPGARLMQIVTAILSVLLLGVPLDPVVMLMLASTIAIVTAFGRVESKVSFLDFGLLLFYASSCISTAFAYDVAVALPQLVLRSVCLLIYLAYRRDQGITDLVCALVSVRIVLHCAVSIAQFLPAYLQWRSLGFDSLVDFRASVVLTANGAKPGNYAATYILATSVAVHRIATSQRELVKFISFVAAISSIACMLLSFSRGLYLALVVLLIAAFFALRKSTVLSVRSPVAIAYCLLVFGVAASVSRPIGSAIVDAALMASRPSQVASTSGRLTALHVGLALAAHTRFQGSGLYNYALALRHNHLTRAHLTGPLDLILQVTVEQGYFGLLATLCVASLLLLVIIVRHGRSATCPSWRLHCSGSL